MRFNTFDQVAKWYNDTKPIISKHHDKGHDVRPIGDRKRKWERIKKVNDNMYILTDGNYANTIYGPINPKMSEYEIACAPIVWMREADGDYVRVRNHNEGCTSVTRYNFLHYHLPDAIRFRYNQAGHHWVSVGGEDYPLPKAKAGLIRSMSNSSTTSVVTEFHDDGTSITFKANADGTFTRVSAPLKVATTRVDIAAKKMWKERINEYYNYVATMAPLIDNSWGTRNEYNKQIADWIEANGIQSQRVWFSKVSGIPAEVMRGVVSNEEHELRVAVTAFVAHEIGAYGVGSYNYQTGEREHKYDIKKIRASYNRMMNKALGLYLTEEK